MSSFYQKFRVAQAEPAAITWAAELSEECPTLSEALLGELPENGRGRRTQGLSILVFCDDDRLKVRLQLRQRRLACFVTIGYHENLWKLLESLLSGDTLEWRNDRR